MIQKWTTNKTNHEKYMKDLLYKELSYKLNGIAFEIMHLLSSGHREKVYSDAFEECLKRDKIPYQRELYYPIKINEKIIAQKYFDFLVDNKIVVEMKAGDKNYRDACYQLFDYLKFANLKLGLIIRFTNNGARIKRIPNLR